MPQYITISFHQCHEMRKVSPRHGRRQIFADEPHERDAGAWENVTATLHLKRGSVGEVPVAAGIVGAMDDERLSGSVPKCDDESAARGAVAVPVAFDGVVPKAVVEVREHSEDALIRHTVAEEVKIKKAS